MCGIVGTAGAVAKRERDVFNNLLLWDVVRGPHSTGVASIKKNNDIVYLKRAMNSFDLMDLKQYDPVCNDSKVLIGHNRWATTGGISHRNAHPFLFDELIGVHNGTLEYASRKRLEDNDKFDTDSEALFYNIGKNGVDATIGELSPGSAWSLVWWDRVTHELNFLRNKERPMFYTLSDTGREIFWASEPGMLRAALARNQVKHKEVWSTSEDILYTFAIPDKYEEIPEPVKREVKGKAAPFTFHSPYGHRGLYGSDWEGAELDNWEAGRRLDNTTGVKWSAAEIRQGIGGTGPKPSPLVTQLPAPVNSSPPASSVIKPAGKPQEGVFSALRDMADKIHHKRTEGGENLTEEVEGDDIPFGLEPESVLPDISKKGEIVDFRPRKTGLRLVKGFNGAWWNKADFDKASKNGCVYCEKNITFSSVSDSVKDTVKWLQPDTFLCQECTADPDIMQYLADMDVIPTDKRALN